MDLALPDPGERYRSHAQRARVATEAWALENLYCPRCDAQRLSAHRAGTAVADFACPRCRLDIQLKAKSGRFGASFVNSAYAPKLAAIRARTLPDYALLSYDRAAWRVTDVTILPGHFLSEANIFARAPLSATAKRAGWVGSNVVLRELPPDAFVRIVDEERPRAPGVVRAQYGRFEWLKKTRAESAGWTAAVLREVRRLAPLVGTTFRLSDLYASAEIPLARAHPENRHVRDKIRQQLQVLRDQGILAFEARGNYRVLA